MGEQRIRARIRVVIGASGYGNVVEIDHATDSYRTRLHELFSPCIDGEKVNRDAVRSIIPAVR